MSTTFIGRAGLSSAQKREMLAELLRKKAGESGSEFPLSYGQKALLYLNRLHPDATAYNAMFVSRVSGKLTLDTLHSAFQQVIDRHAVLCTSYVRNGDRFVQRICPTQKADFEAYDAATWNKDDLERHLLEEASRPYDLEGGSVIRLRVYACSRETHLLMLGVHHIAFDYWSYDVFVHDLTEIYSSIEAGGQNVLSPLKYQFVDFVRRQNELLIGRQGERLFQYWKKELAGEVPILNLPVDRIRRMVQTYKGSAFGFALDAGLVERLRALAKGKNLTLYVLLLAAFQVLLHRYSGQQDILIGSPMVSRDALEFEHLIGYFSNIVPLRAKLAGDPPFSQFVTQVRDTVLGALEHQDYPFPLLVERLAPRRDVSRSPLFDVVFSWEQTRRSAARPKLSETSENSKSQLPLELLYARQLGAPYDLTLLIFEGQEQMSGTLLYNSDLFDEERIANMASHFQTLLQGIADDPAVQVSKIPLLSAAERKRQIVTWNATTTSYPRTQSIPELFESQAQRTPEATAVFEGHGWLSYRELNQRANQLAWYLRKRGVEAGSVVGVCLDRSVDLLVALLAILKAGGAYVPFDPSYPRERLKFIIEDSGAGIVLADKRKRGQLSEDAGNVLWLEAIREQVEAEQEVNPPCVSNGASLAYIMYTSGSTGTPKGVEVLHRGIVRLVIGQDYAQFGPEEVILQAAPASFDASTFEIWGALLHGAKCALFPGEVPTARELGEAIKQYQVTTLWLTSSLFNAIVDVQPEILAPLRQLLIGGEALSVARVRCLRERLPNIRLINGYGPTETTTFACTFSIPANLSPETSSIPIGRPIANTTVYVLDEGGEPVAVGLSGELCIGGDGVARGYRNRPELNAERFTEDRFSVESEAKMYHTGDLVRYRADGNLEFLGRMDQQVKIRGFRIEPGEIEEVLRKHPGIREAVVLPLEDVGGEKRLVAYVVVQDTAVGISEVRRWMKDRVPEYMIPSAIVLLEHLPINANGKVDKIALPVPEQGRPELEQPFVAPESDLEHAIASIWKNALGLEEVGRYDNFFDLGGHSLMVVQLHPKVERAAGRKVAIVDVFRYPTISSLAKHLGQAEQPDPSFDKIHERAQQQKLALAQRPSASGRGRLARE